MDTFTTEWQAGGSDGTRILKLSGPFTLTGLFDFQWVIRQDPPPVLILDLSGVPYMDSASLGALLGIHVSCQRDNRKYALAGVPDRLKTLFRVAGVDKILVIYPSVADAEAALGSSAASA